MIRQIYIFSIFTSFFTSSSFAIAGIENISEMHADRVGFFQVRCNDNSSEIVSPEQIKSDQVCNGEPAIGKKFKMTKSAFLNEGNRCTADGWENTDRLASNSTEYEAKKLCVLNGNWKSFVRLDLHCIHDCTEAYGTVSSCEGWFRCSNMP